MGETSTCYKVSTLSPVRPSDKDIIKIKMRLKALKRVTEVVISQGRAICILCKDENQPETHIQGYSK